MPGLGRKGWDEGDGKTENEQAFPKEKSCSTGPVLINVGFGENRAPRVYGAEGM